MSEKKKTGRPKLMSQEKLAETLFQVFARKGYASTTIADLTQASGTKPATLYLAFGNKEGMYEAALNYYRINWLRELEEILNNPEARFEQRIREFLYAAFTLFSCDEKPLGCMLTFSALAFENDQSQYTTQLRDERLAFCKWLESEALKAQAAGELTGKLGPAEFASLIITFERGLALSTLDEPDPKVMLSMLDGLLNLLFGGH